MKIENGKKVTLHYKGKHEDGSVFDESTGKDPLEFTIGANQVIPGFELGVIGLEAGDNKTIEIEPKDAYGDFRDDLLAEVPRANVPEGTEVGTQLQTEINGQPVPVTVKEIKDETIVIDANHPLAGKKLIFDLEVVGVE
jgi:FKBP-type peptidyl-prolyl cis-trans isomerase 2